MSTRDELAANLTAYIDGELSELETRRLEEALKADPELAALERTMRATLQAVEKLPHPEASQALKRAVLNRLDEIGRQPVSGDAKAAGGRLESAFEKLRAFFTLPRLVPAVGLAAAAAVAVVVSRPDRVDGPALDAETLFVAQHMEVLEDLDLIGLENPDDLDVVASLHELEATP